MKKWRQLLCLATEVALCVTHFAERNDGATDLGTQLLVLFTHSFVLVTERTGFGTEA